MAEAGTALVLAPTLVPLGTCQDDLSVVVKALTSKPPFIRPSHWKEFLGQKKEYKFDKNWLGEGGCLPLGHYQALFGGLILPSLNHCFLLGCYDDFEGALSRQCNAIFSRITPLFVVPESERVL